MVFLLVGTVLSGVIANSLLYHFGFRAMFFRYPSAVTLSYLFFLGVIWLWLRAVVGKRGVKRMMARRPRNGSRVSAKIGDLAELAAEVADTVDVDIVEVADVSLRTTARTTSAVFPNAGSENSGGSVGKNFGLADLADADDAGIGVIIAGIALVVAMVGSAVYMIIETPNMLSEAIFQAGLVVEAKCDGRATRVSDLGTSECDANR